MESGRQMRTHVLLGFYGLGKFEVQFPEKTNTKQNNRLYPLILGLFYGSGSFVLHIEKISEIQFTEETRTGNGLGSSPALMFSPHGGYRGGVLSLCKKHWTLGGGTDMDGC